MRFSSDEKRECLRNSAMVPFLTLQDVTRLLCYEETPCSVLPFYTKVEAPYEILFSLGKKGTIRWKNAYQVMYR